MDDVKEKLTLLQSTKRRLKDTLSEKGVDMQDNPPFSQYPEKIDEASGGVNLFQGWEFGKDWFSVAQTVDTVAAPKKIAYGNGVFVLAYETMKYVLVIDETCKAQQITITSSYSVKSVIYANGKFIVLTNLNAYYSYDAYEWFPMELPAPGTNREYVDIAFGNGKFVAVTRSTVNNLVNQSTYSEDGLSWSAFISMSYNASNGRIYFVHDRFIIIPYNYTSNNAITSQDGVNWISITIPVLSPFKSFLYMNDQWYCYLGSGTSYYTSSNLSTWTAHAYSGLSARNAYLMDGLVILLCGNGTIRYSEDGGETFVAKATQINNNADIDSLAYSSNLVIVGGGYGVCLFSPKMPK